jgi:hypothetical protein
VITRVIDRLKGFIETFDENMGICEAEWTLHGLISFEDIFGALRVLHHQRAHIQLKKILARISRLCLRKHYPRTGKARLAIFSRDNKMPLEINMHKIQHIEGIWGRFGGISEIFSICYIQLRSAQIEKS